jgi:hypothetical protein
MSIPFLLDAITGNDEVEPDGLLFRWGRCRKSHRQSGQEMKSV